ncbi:MAG: GspH/FimT family pseudopilin [Candidatus Nealsonbacteria bacterium]|nr:GspH/FimT family pseudopilin [Candidatus Nealsonbacteria bacterium]
MFDNKKGFTLIEILIAISFISVVFLISLYSLKGLAPDLELSGTARELATDLRYAQQTSITEQADYCIKMFFDLKKYQVIKCDESQIILEKVLPGYISGFFSTVFAGDKIEFNPYGAVKESGTVTFTNTNNRAKTVDIKASGFVKIND